MRRFPKETVLAVARAWASKQPHIPGDGTRAITMNIDLRRMIIHEAMEQYEAVGRMLAATDAEKTLARLKVSECMSMLEELVRPS